MNGADVDDVEDSLPVGERDQARPVSIAGGLGPDGLLVHSVVSAYRLVRWS